MNSRLTTLLKQCKVAEIPQLIDNEKSIIIKKIDTSNFEINHCYELKIDIVKLDVFKSILLSNWGDKKLPSSEVIDVEIKKMLGQMVYCFSPIWEGWLPKNCLTIIKEL